VETTLPELLPEQPPETQRRHLPGKFAAGLAVAAVLFGGVNTEAAAKGGPPEAAPISQPITETLPEETTEFMPHLELGGEDDRVIMNDNEEEAHKILSMARDMGFSRWRMMIHPDKLEKLGMGPHERAVDRIVKHGMQPNVVITCEGKEWTKESFYKYVSSITNQLRDKVHVYAICNEPNYPGWLIVMADKTPAETYAQLFVTGQNAIKKRDKGAIVEFGEFSSKPLKVTIKKDGVNTRKGITMTMFMHDTIKAVNKIVGGPAPIDRIAVHPYQLTSSPFRPSPVSGEQGMGSMGDIEDAIDEEYEAGSIRTPNGGRPLTEVTESGYHAPTRGEDEDPDLPDRMKLRYIQEPLRSRYYRRLINIGCNDKKMAVLYSYDFDTPSVLWPGWWNSPFLDLEDKILPPAVIVQKFGRNHPKCIKQSPVSLAAPTLVAGQVYQPLNG
jgi:hypothetical protein